MRERLSDGTENRLHRLINGFGDLIEIDGHDHRHDIERL